MYSLWWLLLLNRLFWKPGTTVYLRHRLLQRSPSQEVGGSGHTHPPPTLPSTPSPYYCIQLFYHKKSSIQFFMKYILFLLYFSILSSVFRLIIDLFNIHRFRAPSYFCPGNWMKHNNLIRCLQLWKPERQERSGPCCLLKLGEWGLKEFKWLVRWACCASTKDFWSVLAALVGPRQNIFFSHCTLHFNSFVPIA